MTDRPWFGPAGDGRGWRILTWQGAVATVAFVVVAAVCVAVFHGSPAGSGLVAGAFVVYLLVVLFTGDPPGPVRGR